MAALLNFVAFQIGWFACVLGGAHQTPMLGTSIALTLVVFHLARAAGPAAELKLILAAAGIGIALDSTLMLFGFTIFTSGTWLPGIAPHWMVALWMIYATTLNVSLRWLKERMALAIVFGAIGGPLAYWAGAKLGALRLEPLAPALVAIGVAWAAAMWLLIRLARRFDGVTAPLTVARPA